MSRELQAVAVLVLIVGLAWLGYGRLFGEDAAERLVISSDCGMGREGMGRRHAAYKMVSMVLGTNIVRKELGLPEAECLAADPRYSLTETKG